MKTLLMIIALVTALLIIRHLWRQNRRQAQHPRTTQQMAQCAHCGLYLPKDEAVSHHGKLYCCPGHKDAAGRH